MTTEILIAILVGMVVVAFIVVYVMVRIDRAGAERIMRNQK